MGIVSGWEFILLIVLAIVILGPTKLPEYSAKLARLVMNVRRMAYDARGQLREQMGPEFDELNWKQYDPRQYDPRKIVREALMEPLEDAFSIEDGRSSAGSDRRSGSTAADELVESGAGADGTSDGPRPTPWDPEAT
ncbi:twin-arginine translocase TatA/TatE family subunit [Janibacter alkaliphilus]|uniref:Sec-independent protein translocase protein TatB n=1 Tax=Janibacter alkaliphilus TaxID=1069963 RepID=A0A852X4C5_9MICO|nr:sec-independent protein translocase protein TatB [Janibacter alkaliphilus]